MTMKKLAVIVSVICMLAAPFMAQASNPEQDLKNFRKYFTDRFPNVPFQDFANGVYAVDKGHRDQWEAFEEFPTYLPLVDKGQEIFETKFANGKSFADCFPNYKKGIRQNYPYYDSKSGEVVTLEGAINACREANGEKPFKWKKGPIAQVSAYIAYQSRGKTFNIKVPNDPKAMAIYERGKKHFYAKRGQLNMSCADCHQYNSGNRIRANTLSPALGHPTGFPVYRNKWANLGTLHRRYGGCNKQVRAKPFPAQSDEYKALEYFETYMSNGLKVNGPSIRE